MQIRWKQTDLVERHLLMKRMKMSKQLSIALMGSTGTFIIIQTQLIRFGMKSHRYLIWKNMYI